MGGQMVTQVNIKGAYWNVLMREGDGCVMGTWHGMRREVRREVGQRGCHGVL